MRLLDSPRRSRARAKPYSITQLSKSPISCSARFTVSKNNFAAEIDDLNRYRALDSTSPRSERARSALAEAQRALSKESSGAIVLPLAKARAAGLR
jgi:hypothetical protein